MISDPLGQSSQLTLPVSIKKQDSFETFVAGENQQLVSHIQDLLASRTSYPSSSQRISVFHGQSGVGKTHLQLAACDYALQHKLEYQYIDLLALATLPPQALLGLTNCDLVCIDNLQQLDDDFEWQKGIFDVINQFIENDAKMLLLSSNSDPQNFAYPLPDLKTRLAWGINFVLTDLPDNQKELALGLHLEALGINVNAEVVKFIFSRSSRNMKKLAQTIKELDEASLQNKRKLTIPFVKQVLSL